MSYTVREFLQLSTRIKQDQVGNAALTVCRPMHCNIADLQFGSGHLTVRSCAFKKLVKKMNVRDFDFLLPDSQWGVYPTVREAIEWFPQLKDVLLKGVNGNNDKTTSTLKETNVIECHITDQDIKPFEVRDCGTADHDTDVKVISPGDVYDNYGYSNNLGKYRTRYGGSDCKVCATLGLAVCSTHGLLRGDTNPIFYDPCVRVKELQDIVDDNDNKHNAFEKPVFDRQVIDTKEEQDILIQSIVTDNDVYNGDLKPIFDNQNVMDDYYGAYNEVKNAVFELVETEFKEKFGVCEKRHEGTKASKSNCSCLDFSKEIFTIDHKSLHFQKMKFYSGLICKLLACFEEVYLQIREDSKLKIFLRNDLSKKLKIFQSRSSPQVRRFPRATKIKRPIRHRNKQVGIVSIPVWMRSKRKILQGKKNAKVWSKKRTFPQVAGASSSAASECMSEIHENEPITEDMLKYPVVLLEHILPTTTPVCTEANIEKLEPNTLDIDATISQSDFYAKVDGKGLRGFAKKEENLENLTSTVAECYSSDAAIPAQTVEDSHEFSQDCSLEVVVLEANPHEGDKSINNKISTPKKPRKTAGKERENHSTFPRQSRRKVESGSYAMPRTTASSWSVLKEAWSTQRIRRRGISQETIRKLESILSSIRNIRESDFIHKFDMRKEVPNYQHTNPMNLAEISSKLRCRIYETVEQVVHDFRRILFNIRLNYERDEEKGAFYDDSFIIGRMFDRLLAQHFDGYIYPDISGDPMELRNKPALRYRVWDNDSDNDF